MSDDLLDVVALGEFDRRAGRIPRRARTQSSLLWMIRYELGQPVDSEDPKSPTRLQAIARRLLEIAMFGKEDTALRAMQLLLAYFEGEPRHLVQFEIVRAAKGIAEQAKLDPQALIEEAERIAAEAGFYSE